MNYKYNMKRYVIIFTLFILIVLLLSIDQINAAIDGSLKEYQKTFLFIKTVIFPLGFIVGYFHMRTVRFSISQKGLLHYRSFIRKKSIQVDSVKTNGWIITIYGKEGKVKYYPLLASGGGKFNFKKMEFDLHSIPLINDIFESMKNSA